MEWFSLILFDSDNLRVLSEDSATAHMHRCLRVQRPPPFFSHLSSTLAFAPLICSCYISILHLFLHQEGASKKGEETCPLWVAKRLPFERSNPLHHISHNLLSFPITLWESISASFSHPALLLSIFLPLVFSYCVSYCCLAAFNPPHHSAIFSRLLFLHPLCTTYTNIQNSGTTEKRGNALIRYERCLHVFKNQLYLYRHRHTSIFCVFRRLLSMCHEHVTHAALGGSSSCLIWLRAGESSSSCSPPPLWKRANLSFPGLLQ